ncbi:MAG: PorV/PorQ family protein [candidate division KSB1 bacterium]|nr:PorV/PorQ family protein [candidate division KSB1 bacterium]
MTSKRLAAVALVLLAAVTCTSVVLAGNKDKKGSAGALELLIPVGSRITAMGGAGSAIVTGNEAIFWNPAGLAGSPASAEATFSHLNWIFDTSIEWFAVSAKFGQVGSIGVSGKIFDFGDIHETTEFETEGTGRVITPTFVTLGLTYSRQMTDRIFFGLNAKLIHESFLRMSSNGVAFDFGVQYVSQAGLRMGLTLNNLGPMMKYAGPDLQRTVQLPHTEAGAEPLDLRIEAQSYELPSNFEISLAYPVKFGEVQQLTGLFSYRNHNASTDEWQGGLEYAFNDMLFVRGGYGWAGEDQANYIFGFSAGAGLKYKLPGGTAFVIDYAYRDVKWTDGNQWLTISVQF